MGRRQQRRVRERRARQSGGGKQPPRASGPPTRARGTGGRPPGRSSGGLNAWIIGLGLLVVAAVAGGLAYAATHNSNSSAVPTPNLTSGPTVDGIPCGSSEQLVYHIHQHLALYDHGRNVPLPSSIGIVGGETPNFVCLYWIHVHQLYPGIIHVESPTSKLFTLGNFFDIWKATTQYTTPQSSNAFLTKLLAAPESQITVYVDGKRWTKGYRTVALAPHAVIQISLGTPVVPFKPFSNWGTL